MYQLLNYYGKWHGFKSRIGRMPAVAKFLVGLAALPGILCVLLSIVLLVVSLVALFVPANLAYRLATWLTGGRSTDVDRANPLGGTDFVAEQHGGGTDAGPADDDDRAPDPTTPAPDAVVIDPEPPTRPRRQIEVKIVD